MIPRLTFLMLFLASSLSAEVVRVEVKNRADLLSGKTFGSVGGYEKLSGKIYFAVDPANSANRTIVDIDKSHRNLRLSTASRALDLYDLSQRYQSVDIDTR